MDKSGRKRKRPKKTKRSLTSSCLDGSGNKIAIGNFVENNSNDQFGSFVNHGSTKSKKSKRRRKRRNDIATSNVLEGLLTFDSKSHKESEQTECVSSVSVENKYTDSHTDTHTAPENKEEVPQKNNKRTCSLKERLQNKLESGRFRWINEKLYTSNSKCASELFEKDPALFNVYHQGFSSQVKKWPVNPVDVMIKWIKQRSPQLIIVDMGCGEAKISQSVPNKVHSFDLVAANKFVTACDMAKVPLPDNSVHVVVYCLSLMGTNLNDFLREAHRILKNGGIMLVAEVVSRFKDMDYFEQAVSQFGFSLQSKDTTNKMFAQFEFTKLCQEIGSSDIFSISLKPCLYKKR